MTELEREIRGLEERLLRPEVRASGNALDELLADDFVEHGRSGRRFDKRGIIDALRNEPRFEASIEEFSLRALSPDVVLATYRAVSRVAHRDRPESSRRSSIWVRRGGRWQLTFHQGTLERRED